MYLEEKRERNINNSSIFGKVYKFRITYCY